MVYRAMGRAHVGWGGVWGDGKGACGIGRCMRRWEGRGRDREVFEAMGSAQEGWSAVWGDGKGACWMGRHMGRWEG